MQAAWRRLRDWLDSLQPSWLRRLVILASISAGALMIGAAIAIVGAALYSWSPSGFGASTARTTTVTTGNVVDTYETQPGKTLWDWMGLLLVPAILAGGAWWFNRQERKAERQTQEQRRADDQAFQKQRDESERELAQDNQRETALEAYLDTITELLLEKGLQSSPRRELREVARTKTMTVLRRLDGQRKGIVVRSYEAT